MKGSDIAAEFVSSNLTDPIRPIGISAPGAASAPLAIACASITAEYPRSIGFQIAKLFVAPLSTHPAISDGRPRPVTLISPTLPASVTAWQDANIPTVVGSDNRLQIRVRRHKTLRFTIRFIRKVIPINCCSKVHTRVTWESFFGSLYPSILVSSGRRS